MVKLKNREACYRELLWIFILYILISTAEPSRTKLPSLLALVRRRRSLIARNSGSYGGSCSHRDYCIGQSVGYYVHQYMPFFWGNSAIHVDNCLSIKPLFVVVSPARIFLSTLKQLGEKVASRTDLHYNGRCNNNYSETTRGLIALICRT